MRFHDFNKRLEKAELSPQARFLLSHIFETMRELQKQFDMQTTIILNMVQALEGVNALNTTIQGTVERLTRHVNLPEGVTVESVQNDPETEH